MLYVYNYWTYSYLIVQFQKKNTMDYIALVNSFETVQFHVSSYMKRRYLQTFTGVVQLDNHAHLINPFLNCVFDLVLVSFFDLLHHVYHFTSKQTDWTW